MLQNVQELVNPEEKSNGTLSEQIVLAQKGILPLEIGLYG